MLLSSRSPSPKTRVGLILASGIRKPFGISPTWTLPVKYGAKDSDEALTTEKGDILTTPASAAASNKTLELPTACAKGVLPRPAGAVKDFYSFQLAAKPVRVREVQRSRLHPSAKGV